MSIYEGIEASLREALEPALGECVQFEDCGEGRRILDLSSERLAFLLELFDEELVIRNIRIEPLFQGRGIAQRIVDAVHACADEYGLMVVADRVEDAAIGFWELQGYELRANAPKQYIRSPGL